MSTIEKDEQYMRRCLQLARNGRQNAKPNPMVGAVIVAADGRIIGEGYHVRCGEGHAEVNAFASVRPKDEPLLHAATLYVSLEPCSHYGKTPPCADLIVRKGVRRVVCGCIDPFSEVQGHGVSRIRQAGIEVTVGVLEADCLALNQRFVTFHTHHRPYLLLKYAQTANGYLDRSGHALALSTAFTQMLVHKLRAEYDAILVGRITDEREHPSLDVRHWSGPNPERLVLSHTTSPREILDRLYQAKRQSLLVEGGRQTLQAFLDAGLWDELRIETAPMTVADGTPTPQLPPNICLIKQEEYDGNIIRWYRRED